MSDEMRLARLVDVPGLADVVDVHQLMLLRFANEMAGFYQSSVYLCGSALTKADPRDIDLRISLPDGAFEARYGGTVADWIEQGRTGQWGDVRWNWSKDCTRQTHRGWRETPMNVDLQVYPASWGAQEYGERPRVRIDEVMQ